MSYNNNIPQASDLLSDSQGDLLLNFQTLDNSFGVDHYAFSNLTADNGKHNTVTTPIVTGNVHPTTAADEPKFYNQKISANFESIQYSRGGSDAVPTPVTRINSPATPVVLISTGTTPMIDLSGVPLAIFRVIAVDTISGVINQSIIIFQAGSYIIPLQPAFSLDIFNAGTVLQLVNLSANVMNVYWHLEFYRLQ